MLFEDLKFKCNFGACKQEYLYENAFKHIRKCAPRSFACVLNCGCQNMKGKEELEEHLNEQCPLTLINCHECGKELRRE